MISHLSILWKTVTNISTLVLYHLHSITLDVTAQLLNTIVCQRKGTAVLPLQVYAVMPHQSQCGLETGIKGRSAAAFQHSRFTLLVEEQGSQLQKSFDRSSAQNTLDYN